MTRASRGGLALDAVEDLDGSSTSVSPADKQQPLEDYGRFLPTDKLALHEIAPVHRLAGHVQGPGRLGALLRAGRRP